MNAEFSRTLSLLRQEKKVSQRTAAAALGISQALLSHYENGIREPGLVFVVKACDYYGVSADFLLGRTLTRDGATITPDELYDISDEKNNSLKGSVLALLCKKLLVNSIGVLFGLLGKTGSREAIQAAATASDGSIITSSLVMFCATLGVGLISEIEIISSICTMLARGALISALVSIFLMPAVLCVCEPLLQRTSFHWRETEKAVPHGAEAL